MTRNPGGVVAWFVTALLAASVLTACTVNDGDQLFDDAVIHNADDQPLHFGLDADPAPGGMDWSSFVSWWTADEPETSFGFHLCVDGTAEASITSVEPLVIVGDTEVLPVMLMAVSDPNSIFISSAGYPPELEVGDELSPAETTPVTAQCGDPKRAQGLIVALRAVDKTGGGWRGVGIEYMVDGEEYRLEIPAELYMCGTSTEPCGE